MVRRDRDAQQVMERLLLLLPELLRAHALARDPDCNGGEQEEEQEAGQQEEEQEAGPGDHAASWLLRQGASQPPEQPRTLARRRTAIALAPFLQRWHPACTLLSHRWCFVWAAVVAQLSTVLQEMRERRPGAPALQRCAAVTECGQVLELLVTHHETMALVNTASSRRAQASGARGAGAPTAASVVTSSGTKPRINLACAATRAVYQCLQVARELCATGLVWPRVRADELDCALARLDASSHSP